MIASVCGSPPLHYPRVTGPEASALSEAAISSAAPASPCRSRRGASRWPSPQSEDRAQHSRRLAALVLSDADRGRDVEIAGQGFTYCTHSRILGNSPAVRPTSRGKQLVETGGSGVKLVQLEIPVLIPVAVQDQQPDGSRRIALQQIADQDKIACRLGHLGAVDRHNTGVKASPGKRSYAGKFLRQRGLICVVREAQISATGVHVDGWSESMQCHGRTFGVPAWPTRPPWARPGDLVGGQPIYVRSAS